MNDVKELLLEKAIAKGICDEGAKRITNSDREELVKYYLTNPDWAMERNIPDLQTLRDEFSDLDDKGIFVGREFHGETLSDRLVYILHDCHGTIRVGLNTDKGIAPMLYVANGCRLRIIGTGIETQREPMMIPIYIIGANDISARRNRYVKFTIFKKQIK